MEQLSLTDDDIEVIVKRAQGLFIFASTTIRLLWDKKFSDPAGQLKRLLASTAHLSDTSPYAHLDKLYMTILEKKFNGTDEALLAKVQTALSILIIARKPLTVHALEGFMPGTVIRAILQDLHSLISIPDKAVDTAIRLIHPSFRDFLLDEKRCSKRFVIIRPNDVLTQCCAKRLIQFANSEEPDKDIVWVISDYGAKICIPSLKVLPDEIQTGPNISLSYASDHFGHHLALYCNDHLLRITCTSIGLVAINIFLRVKYPKAKYVRCPLPAVIKFLISEIQAPLRVEEFKTWPIEPLPRSMKKEGHAVVPPNEMQETNRSSSSGVLSGKKKKSLILVWQSGFKPDNFYFLENGIYH